MPGRAMLVPTDNPSVSRSLRPRLPPPLAQGGLYASRGRFIFTAFGTAINTIVKVIKTNAIPRKAVGFQRKLQKKPRKLDKKQRKIHKI